MPLVGSLRDLSLPELLAVIAGGEKSGVITIRSDAGTAQIHVNRGRIVQASDTLRDERFGEILLKLGKISQETLTAALEAQEMSGGSRRLGVILVEMEAISDADQDAAVLYQTCEALYDLCTWQVGYFQFDAQEVPEQTAIAIPVDTLLEEVDRRAKAGERTRSESLRPAESPLRGRRELTPDKMELLRLRRSFQLKTDEFSGLTDSDIPGPHDRESMAREPEPGEPDPAEPPPAAHSTRGPGPTPGQEEPVFDIGDLETRTGEGESL